nr:hypothetical protein BaRGS_013501 [Batillaria attramentaria]
MRRTVARYMMFGMILIMRAVSVAVMKRFPTLDHIVEAGFITKDEAEIYEKTECQYLKFWVPLMWASNVLTRARHEGRIETEFGLRMVIEVVTLAVYSFFAACLVGRQFLDTEKNYPGYEYDIYVPVFTLLQFFFYMGWLKLPEGRERSNSERLENLESLPVDVRVRKKSSPSKFFFLAKKDKPKEQPSPKLNRLEDIEETAELSSTPVPSVPIITIDEV